MLMRRIPPWATELKDELEEVIKEKSQERGIEYEYIDDSKKLEDALNQIRMVMERLDKNQTKRDTWNKE